MIIVGLVPTVLREPNWRIAKYLHQELDGVVPFANWPYGMTGDVQLFAADLGDAEITLLESKPDVILFPSDLSRTPDGKQASAMQASLESVNIPATWVSTMLRWDNHFRILHDMMEMAQIMHGAKLASLVPGGKSLDTSLAGMSAKELDDLDFVSLAVGLDTKVMPRSTTIRSVIKSFADVRPSPKPIPIFRMEI